jgi:hypothetical protein
MYSASALDEYYEKHSNQIRTKLPYVATTTICCYTQGFHQALADCMHVHRVTNTCVDLTIGALLGSFLRHSNVRCRSLTALLNVHQPIVLRDSLSPERSAGLEMPRLQSNSEICDQVVCCLPGAIGHED